MKEYPIRCPKCNILGVYKWDYNNFAVNIETKETGTVNVKLGYIIIHFCINCNFTTIKRVKNNEI